MIVMSIPSLQVVYSSRPIVQAVSFRSAFRRRTQPKARTQVGSSPHWNVLERGLRRSVRFRECLNLVPSCHCHYGKRRDDETQDASTFSSIAGYKSLVLVPTSSDESPFAEVQPSIDRLTGCFCCFLRSHRKANSLFCIRCGGHLPTG